jgi:hypothetical protein
MEVSGQPHAPVALPLGKELSRPENKYASGDKGKKLCPCQESNSGHPACCLVTVMTEISQLLETDILVAKI